MCERKRQLSQFRSYSGSPGELFFSMITHTNGRMTELRMCASPSGGLFAAHSTNENANSRSFVRTRAQIVNCPSSQE